mgnify:CR=1 FL=1
MSSFCDMTATDLRQMIGRKDISPVELVEASIERIEMVDSSLNAVVTKNYEAARKAAKTAEKNICKINSKTVKKASKETILFNQ